MKIKWLCDWNGGNAHPYIHDTPAKPSIERTKKAHIVEAIAAIVTVVVWLSVQVRSARISDICNNRYAEWVDRYDQSACHFVFIAHSCSNEMHCAHWCGPPNSTVTALYRFVGSSCLFFILLSSLVCGRIARSLGPDRHLQLSHCSSNVRAMMYEPLCAFHLRQ